MRDAFVAKLSDMARQDSRVMLVTGDLGFGVLTQFAEEFPAQFLNAGVSEQNMTLLATGLALAGKIVYTYSIANFPTLRPLEMIRNDACYHGANVNIVAIGGGFSYGPLGASHHATEDLAIMRSLPDITVVAPCDLFETQMATEALARVPGTTYLRLDKDYAPDSNEDSFGIGKARTLRNGDDVTLIACGGIVKEALQAAERLEGEGVSCRVVSMHTIKPIDGQAILDAAEETGGIVTLEEHTIDGGLGGAVAEVCMDAGVFPKKFARMGLRAGFSSLVGSQEYLRRQYGLDAESVCATVKAMVSPERSFRAVVEARP